MTPYAQAILDCYEDHHPLIISVPTKFAGTNYEITNVVTHPQQYDTLILGTSSQVSTESDSGTGPVLLKITHSATGLSWNSSAPLDASPIRHLSGAIGEKSPIMPLPEAFFLPAKTWMTHRWQNNANSATTGGSLTYLALQLTRPKGGVSPTHVTMPDGCQIPIGTRRPWFFTVPVGQEVPSSGIVFYTLTSGQKFIEFTEPDGCDVELHGITTNLPNSNLVSFQVKLADVGSPPYWSMEQSNAFAVFGEPTQAYNFSPLPLPYLLKRTHRMRVNFLYSPGSDLQFVQRYITFSGVRRSCEGTY